MSLTPIILAELQRIRSEIGRLEAQESILVRLIATASAVHDAGGEAVAREETRTVEAGAMPKAPAEPKPILAAEKGRKPNAWTADEIETLKRTYAEGGIEGAMLALPHRTKSAITWRACHHRITSPKGIRLGRGWTQAEDAVMIDRYPCMGAAISALLPGRSPVSITKRAQKLGLERGRGRRPSQQVPTKAAAAPSLRPAPSAPLTFDQQLEAVRNGAKLVDVVPIPRAPCDQRTLGGVVGEIL